MRVAVPIPCQAPFEWLPGAVKERSDELRAELRAPAGSHEATPAAIVRETLWAGLDWLDKELAAGRKSLRPCALVLDRKKPAPRVAYSLLGPYVAIPKRLERAVKLLNEHEPHRFAGELFGLIRKLNGGGSVDDVYCSRWEPPGGSKRAGIQLGFTVDAKKSKDVVAGLDRLMRYEPTWNNASLARALLARGLKAYAPKDFEQ